MCDCEYPHAHLFCSTHVHEKVEIRRENEGGRHGRLNEPAAGLSLSPSSPQAFSTRATLLSCCLSWAQERRRYGSSWWVYLELWHKQSLPTDAAGQG